MIDGKIRPFIDPSLKAVGRFIAHKTPISANAMTLIGGGLGLLSACLIGLNQPLCALFFMLLSRLADGLDGAIAHTTKRTDFGGYLDIVIDFLFYGAFVVGFIALDPARNGVVGALLLLSFYFNGASFLGYAILAEKHGHSTDDRGKKSLYFTAGLVEGTETISFYVILCLWPSSFVYLGSIFAALTLMTTISRILMARKLFGDKQTKS